MINVLIPMAGRGSRFIEAGITTPKPFIDVMGMTMIERVLENLACKDVHYLLIAQEEHINKHADLIAKIKSKYQADFIPINQITEGAACTTLFAREFINNSNALVIANSDQLVDINFQAFIDDCLNKNLDGLIMTFKDPTRNTKWSFASTNEEGLVESVAEKVAISDQATVGIYMFRKGSIYVNSALDMIIRNQRTNNEFYVCPTYNFAILKKYKIGIYEIPQNHMHGLGTPEDLNTYINKNTNNI